MKVAANLNVSVKVMENDSNDSVHDRVIEKLKRVTADWLKGKATPSIKITYELDNEYKQINKKL